MNLPVSITAVLETALNRYIELDSKGKESMAALAGKIIQLDITGLDFKITLQPGLQGVHLMSHFDGEADTIIRGAPFSLLRMSLDRQGEDQLFSGEVQISGDSETGQAFQRILKQLDIDWEEHLSHITGDVIAHQLGSQFRRFMNWGKQTENSILLDSAEFLEEEQQLLANSDEVQRFSRDVDEIRNDVERLQARIHRLQNNDNNG